MEPAHPEPIADPEDQPQLELVPPLDAVEDEREQEDGTENARPADDERLQTSDPLKLYVRQIGDGRLLTAAEERERKEQKMRERIESGEMTVDILDLRPTLQRLGMG